MDHSQVVSVQRRRLTFLVFVQVPAAARAGAIAPCEVTVPAQNTGLGPEKTSFFQALGITTKISRGTIEILVSGPGLPVLARQVVGAWLPCAC